MKKAFVSVLVMLAMLMTMSCMAFAGETYDPIADPYEYLMSLDEKVSVNWMTWSSARSVEWRMQAIFEIYPELKDKIELIHIPGGTDVRAMVQKLRLSVMSQDEVPDVCEIAYSIMPALVAGNMVTDLTEELSGVLPSLLPAAVDVMSYEGKVYGFPGQVKTKLWYYRADMFEKAGIDPAAIKNNEDFFAACRKFKETFPGAYMWFLGQPSESFQFEFMLSGADSKYVNEDGTYNIVNNEDIRAIFEFCKTCFDEDLVATLSYFTPDFESAVRESRLGSIMSGSWFKDQSYIPTYAPDQEGLWAVTTCPPVAAAMDRGSESGGSAFGIANGAKNPEAAKAVLALLSLDEKVSLNVFLNHNAAIEPLTDYGRANPEFKQLAYYGDTLQTAIDAAMEKFDTVNYTPAAMLEFGIISSYLDMYCAGEGELEELLQNCEDDLNMQIGNPYEFAE